VLQSARERDCPWDENNTLYVAALGVGTCTSCSGCGSATARGMRARAAFAAEGGHLAVLRWAREHGCEWNKAYVRTVAAACGYADMLSWIDEHGE